MKLLTRLCEGGDDLDLDQRVCRPENKKKTNVLKIMQQIFIEINKTLKSDTPGRTYSISGVKSCVLKKHF